MQARKSGRGHYRAPDALIHSLQNQATGGTTQGLFHGVTLERTATGEKKIAYIIENMQRYWRIHGVIALSENTKGQRRSKYEDGPNQ